MRLELLRDMSKSDCSKILSALSAVVVANLKKTGTIIVPGICRVTV